MSIYSDPIFKPKLDPSLYSLQGDELAFFTQQTGTQDGEELRDHIISIQTKAYEIYGYPCIRRFAFIRLKIAHLPGYKEALSLLHERKDPILLDIGCCFGNDVRKAVVDGWPIQHVIASDLRQGFWDYGHELFRSTPETFPAAFIAGDAFSDAFLASSSIPSATSSSVSSLHHVTSLNELHGQVSAVHASSFFHLFSEDQQLDLARRLASLLVPEKGSVIFGQHGAKPEKGFRSDHLAGGKWSMFCHSPESWRQLWVEDVFGADVQVHVDAELILVERKDLPVVDSDDSFWFMNWCVTRL